MSRRLRLAFLLQSLLLPLVSTSQSQELETLKSATERWIDIRNRIATEESEWETDKEILHSSIETLTAIRDSLSESTKILELESESLEEETANDEARLDKLLEANAFALENVQRFEARITLLAERLPPPLLEKINPLLRKIPHAETSDSLPVANRLQNIVAITTLIDEFNNNLTLTHTIRTTDSGESIEVRILYWGVATAYAINTDGSQAWILTPQKQGWKWTTANDDAKSIFTLFEVYDKNTDPVLTNIPFAFSNEEGVQ